MLAAQSGDDPNPDEWLTPRRAALAAGVDGKTLARLADDGKLATERTGGGHRRYRARDVRAYGAQRVRQLVSNIETITNPWVPGDRDGYITWLRDDDGTQVVGADGAPVAFLLLREGLSPDDAADLRATLVAALRGDAA
jgi:hypothetical protein